MNETEQIIEILTNNNQTKVLELLKNVTEEQRKQLVKELLKVDFNQVKRLYINKDKKNKKEDIIEPIKYVDKNKLNSKQKSELEKLEKKY